MADPSIDVTASPFPSAPGTDIGALVSQNEQQSKQYQAGLAQVRKPFVEEEKRALGEMTARTERDRTRLERASEASGVGPHELPAWNEQEEAAKHTTPPMAQFGSAGMIFAMLASAFTRAPMTNALNGGAAAMKAIQQNDAEGYERAYQAWKSNTDLALKRHQIAREKYQDAMDLMNVDMTLGRARLAAVASELGDVQTQYALETGNDPLVGKLFADRNEQSLRIEEAREKLETQYLPTKAYFKLTEARETLQQAQQSGDPTAVEAAKRGVAAAEQGLRDAAMATGHGYAGRTLSPDQQIMQRLIDENPDMSGEELARRFAAYKQSERPGKEPSPDQTFVHKFFEEHPDASAEDFSKALGEHKKAQKESKTLSPDQQILQRIIDENKDISAADLIKKYDEYKAGQHPGAAGADTNIPPRAKQAEINRRKKDYIKQGMDETTAFNKATREVNAVTAGPSGNRRDDLASRIDMFDNSATKIDEVVSSLERHIGEAGIAGRVTRVGERVGNIFGSNETDRQQFMRDVQYLRLVAPRLLTDSHGRPLSVEAGNVNDVIAGISLGDTTASTLRALGDIKKLYVKMREDDVKRFEGTWEPGASNQPAPAATKGSDTGGGDWFNAYPVVK